MKDIEKEIKYLLNSHHELIIALKKNNDGLKEMNKLLRQLVKSLRENKDE